MKTSKEILSVKARAGAIRWPLLLASALVVAVAIIGVAVWLTPLDDDEIMESVAAESGAQTGAGAADQPKVPRKLKRVSVASLNLPTERLDIEASELRSELEDLAAELVAQDAKDWRATHIAAQTYAELKLTTQAEEVWRSCVARDVQEAGPYAGLGLLLIESGRDQEASTLLKDSYAKGIESEELLIALAESLENLGQLDEAEAVLRDARGKYPQSSKLLLTLGRVLNQLEKFEGAEANIRTAIAGGEDTQSAWLALATALARQGKTEEAAKARKNISVQRGPAAESAFQQQYDEALTRVACQVMLAAASVAEDSGQYDQAEKRIRRAMEIDPDHLKCYMSLSSVYRRTDRLPEALAVHEVLYQKQPENVLNALNLAALAQEMGHIDFAISALDAAAQRETSGEIAHAALAKLRMQVGQFKEAIPPAIVVVERTPSVEAFMLLAAAYQGSGNAEAASAAVARAQQIDPTHPIFMQAAPAQGVPLQQFPNPFPPNSPVSQPSGMQPPGSQPSGSQPLSGQSSAGQSSPAQRPFTP